MDGASVLRCARGFLMPAALLRVGRADALGVLDVHLALLLASASAAIAGAPGAAQPLAVRAGCAAAAAAVFVAVSAPAPGAAALYLSGLHPWLGFTLGAENWHVGLQLVLALVWAEALVRGAQCLGAFRQARVVVFCVAGSALASALLLLAPALIVPAGVHPLFRAAEALGAAVCLSLLAPEHAAVRELMALLAQFAVCVYASVYVLALGGVVPAARYVLVFGGSALDVSAVDMLLGVYYPAVVLVLLAPPPAGPPPPWQAAVLAAGEALDGMFTLVAGLGPTLFGMWHRVGVATFFFTEPAAAALALACVYCAAFTLQFAVEELGEKARAFARRRWARSGRRLPRSDEAAGEDEDEGTALRTPGVEDELADLSRGG
jgi:hypothetical protein